MSKEAPGRGYSLPQSGKIRSSAISPSPTSSEPMTRLLKYAFPQFPLAPALTLAALALLNVASARAAEAKPEAALTLVQDGQPKAVIVVGESLRPTDSAAATLVT